MKECHICGVEEVDLVDAPSGWLCEPCTHRCPICKAHESVKALVETPEGLMCDDCQTLIDWEGFDV